VIDLNVHDWQMLSKGAASRAFLFVKPDESKVDAWCAEGSAQPAS
jgi:hypothetical protein